MKNFAYIISQKRKELGLTQEAFAKELCLTPQAVSKWENGVGLPEVTLFPAIARVLGVSTDELFGMDKTKEASSIPEFPTSYEGLAFVGSIDRRACYSDKVLDHVDGKTFFFDDGSTADLENGDVLNSGKGEIRIMEEENTVWNTKKETSTTLKKELEPFTSLSVGLSLSCNFKLLRGDTFHLEAAGSEHFINAIQTKTEDDALTLTVQSSTNVRENGRENNSIILYVVFDLGKALSLTINGASEAEIAPDFEKMSIFINGSGDATAFDSEYAKVFVNGSGNIKLGSSKNGDLTINGSGDITMKKATESARIHINGCGDVEIGEAKNAELRILGSGDIILKNASGKLSAVISGSGDVEAGGEVENLLCRINGSGDIHGGNLTAETADIRIAHGSSGSVTIGHIKGASRENIGKNGTFRVKKRG